MSGVMRLSAALLLVSALLIGCGVTRSVRIERNRAAFDGWSESVQNAVANGVILKGMSAEMVRVAWGAPSESSFDPSGLHMYWLYPVGDKPALKAEAFPREEGESHRNATRSMEIELVRGEPASTSLVIFQNGLVSRVETVTRKP